MLSKKNKIHDIKLISKKSEISLGIDNAAISSSKIMLSEAMTIFN